MSQMTQMFVEEKRDPQTYAIIGAAMEVHSQLGAGFFESVYHESLALELTDRKIPFNQQVELPIRYKTRLLQCGYKADFICFDQIVVELKALRHLGAAERAQVINYLKATELRRGLLLNFGSGRLEYERYILTPSANASAPSATSVENLDGDE